MRRAGRGLRIAVRWKPTGEGRYARALVATAMSSGPEPVALELPVRYLGSVNVWLLTGEPLTLVDTGTGDARRARDARAPALAARRLDGRHRTGAAHTSSPRPHGPREPDPGALRGQDRSAPRDRRVGPAVRRSDRERSPFHSDADRRARGPGRADPEGRPLLRADHQGRPALRHRHRARRRGCDPGRQPPLADGVASRPQPRPTRCSSTTTPTLRWSAITCSPRSAPRSR